MHPRHDVSMNTAAQRSKPSESLSHDAEKQHGQWCRLKSMCSILRPGSELLRTSIKQDAVEVTSKTPPVRRFTSRPFGS